MTGPHAHRPPRRAWLPWLAATLASVAGAGQRADGQLVPDSQAGNRAAYAAAANPYLGGYTGQTGAGAAQVGGLVTLQISAPGMTTRNTSATVWDGRNVITAAHNFTGFDLSNPATSVSILYGGTNFYTNPGLSTPVAAVHVHPNYAFNNFNQPDIAVLNLASSDFISSAAQTGPRPTSPSMTTAAGYGGFGTPSLGVQPQDGFASGYTAGVRAVNASGILDNLYFSTQFVGYFENAGSGNGTGGYSGGPVFDSQNRLVGYCVGGTGDNSQLCTTFYADINNVTFSSFIVANVVPVPEPRTLFVVSVFGMSVVALARRLVTRRGSPEA